MTDWPRMASVSADTPEDFRDAKASAAGAQRPVAAGLIDLGGLVMYNGRQ